MGCLGWIKTRTSSRSGRRGSSSAPPTTTTTTTASAVNTSRSDDSSGLAGRRASKSTGSASSQSQPSISSLYEERGHAQLRAFDYDELRSVTNDFGRAQKLDTSALHRRPRRPHPRTTSAAPLVPRTTCSSPDWGLD